MERIDQRVRLALRVEMGEGEGAGESGGAMGSMGSLKSARTNVGRRALSFLGDLIRAPAAACSGTAGHQHVHASRL